MDAIQAGNLNAGLAEEDLQIKAGDKLSDQLNAFSLELDELKKSQSNSFTEKLTAEIEAKLAGLSDKAEEEVSGLKDRIGKIVDDALTAQKLRVSLMMRLNFGIKNRENIGITFGEV